MKLEQSFEVAAPLERVWQMLVDVEHVAPCLPGAAITGRNEDGSYTGTFTIKIGPTTASYTGKLEMEQIDEAGHTATMQAQGTDKRGQGGATATIVSKLSPGEGDATRVEVDTDYHITGRLARFGRGGMIEDISERLLREFASRLQASLAQKDEAPAPLYGAPAADRAGSPGQQQPEPGEAEEAGASGADEAAAGAADQAGAGAGEEAGAGTAEEAGAGTTEEAGAGTGEEAGAGTAEDVPPPTEAGAAAEPGPPQPEPPAPPPPPPPSGPPPPVAAEPPRLSGPPSETIPNEPIEGLSLVGSVMVDRAKRNPKPLLGVLGALLFLRFLRRRR